MKILPLPCILLASILPLLPACYKLEAQPREVEPPALEDPGAAHGAVGEGAAHVRTVAHSSESHDAAEHGSAEHGGEGSHHPAHKLVVTSPVAKDVVSTQHYVCQIHSSRHIEICALEGGYLEEIMVREGQAVKAGDPIFKILPVLYQARLDSDVAEAQLAQIELENTERLFQQKIVAKPEVELAKAKLAKAVAKVNLARAEMAFTDIKAPFDGIIDKQLRQQGSLIEEGDVLTTLSDNSLMWVYFPVPEARYLEYMQSPKDDLKVELKLANHQKFNQLGVIGAIEADFNNETGNIAFRADFPNPERLLRHGQTGTVLLSHTLRDVIVIPQRATFEILAKKYAYVVGDDHVVHQREIVIQDELDDIFLIQAGLSVNDKIILEGVRQVRDGEQVEYEYRAPEDVLGQLKYHAE